MLVEQPGGNIRIGFRSKPPLDKIRPDIDVAALAATVGGGGHRRAAGARLPGPLDSARTAVVRLLKPHLSR